MVETLDANVARRVLFPFHPLYDAPMDTSAFEQLKLYVGFSPRDEANLLSLRDAVQPILADVSKRFYDEIRKHEATRRVFRDQSQIERLHHAFEIWLSGLFCGQYGEAYFERRSAIGRTHSEISLPQHFMVGGMTVVWQALEDGILRSEAPNAARKAKSVHKLLMIELAVMLGTYKESYSIQIRNRERSVVEDKLTQAENLAQIGQLAASLAHEIKNPLAGISGAIQVIRDGLGPDDARIPILAEVLTQIDRLDSTVKDLLVYARPKPPKKSACCLNHILDRVLRVLDEEPVLQDIRIERVRCSEARTVFADPAQLEQLAFNLILNAAQASTKGNMIRVTTDQVDSRVTLSVQDFGNGMDAATRKRAFEPFYTTKVKGTGLGLSICKKIIEAHGGRMRLESVEGEGTQVIVELQAHPVETKGPDSC